MEDGYYTPYSKETGRIIDPLKYRRLALQSCIYKVLSTVLNNQITKMLEGKKLLVDEQNGFRKNRSCQHHIFSLMSLIRNRLNYGLDTYCGFVDFRKAFDVVDRDLLFVVLRRYDINGKIINVMEQLYNETTNVVRVNERLTDSFNSKNGV